MQRVDPYETWLQYQAKSYTGQNCTVEEARELFSRVDVSTRQPFETAEKPTILQRALRALRAGLRGSGVTAAVLIVSSCAQVRTPDTEYPIADRIGNKSSMQVYRVYDGKYGVACYISAAYAAVSCVQVAEGEHEVK